MIPLERIRCAVARIIFTRHRYFTMLAIKIAPKGHPWRVLAETETETMNDLTEETLVPRSERDEAPTPLRRVA